MAKYLFFTSVIFMLSLATLFIAITQIDPFGPQKILAFTIFFISTFLTIGAFFTFLSFFAKELFSKGNLNHRYYLVSMRRGGLVGFLVIALLAMYLLRILGLFEITLLIIFLILLELSFLTNKH